MDEEIIKEIQHLKEYVDKLEKKYCFSRDYKLISALLEKLKIDNLEISYEELKESSKLYIANYDEENKIVTIKEYKKQVEMEGI